MDVKAETWCDRDEHKLFEYYVDFNRMALATATLGLAPFRWEASVDPKIPSVGFVEAAVFDPEHWRPDYPNPAFDERTVRDIRWGARIVAAFTDVVRKPPAARAWDTHRCSCPRFERRRQRNQSR